MKDKIYYEWCLNVVDEYGDIQDIAHFDVTLKSTRIMLEEYYKYKEYNGIELCVMWGNEDEGQTDRHYAQVNDMQLPERTDCGYKIPKYIKTIFEKAKGE